MAKIYRCEWFEKGKKKWHTAMYFLYEKDTDWAWDAVVTELDVKETDQEYGMAFNCSALKAANPNY